MYIRDIHAEKVLRVLRPLVRENPLGLFTTIISSPSGSFPLLQTSHIPFILDIEDELSETELGTLRGHLASTNPQSKAIIEETSADSTRVLEHDVLVLFQSPVHAYIPPAFLSETKPKTQKVSEETSAYLNSQIDALTRHMEMNIMKHTGEDGRPKAWKVTDAPEKYTGLLKKAIIGVEIKVERMEGKFKMSQEEPAGDRTGVIEGFRGLGTERARQVADLVEERQELKYGKE
ncbi:hypothetical protein BHE90_002188 [Fusarium euwallaceae]|uniref:Uncharacterized protein n=2 Tax=Fusarium solani species complex TaxID=232080 RepID=A0A3M2SMA6_9HYPO|nr:hypothetical protein CDV36_001951 [Fusarium kuroshium]RTE83364.1 hypothetical protein BHE90_002188 [Fusarium euwallaceae]